MPTDDITVKETLDEFGKPRFIISSPKFKADFIVKKTFDGFSFFEIKTTKGSVPAKLSGSYTTFSKALSDVKNYVASKQPSLTVKRDKTYEENH